MLPISDALTEVLTRARQLGTERVPLASALDRILREDVRADVDSPPFDASAMDGYALRSADTGQPLRLVGTSAAGAAFTGRIGVGECVRIFTGAPVPTDADRVVKQEDTSREGQLVRIANNASASRFIRRRGENRRAGEIVVPSGTPLGPPELAALASIGVSQPLVTRRARCVHLVTGDELVAPDLTPSGAQIRDSNSTLVAHLLTRNGAELVGHAHVRDDLADARTTLTRQQSHDILLLSGGASVGDLDLSRPLLTGLDFTLHFQQINLRPGKPLVFASRGEHLAFVFPGNPVSHWVTFHLFLAPLLRKLATGIDAAPVLLRGRLAANSPPPQPDARQTIWPARVTILNGEHQLTLLPLVSSGDSSGLVGANALIPLTANGLDPSRPVEFIPCP